MYKIKLETMPKKNIYAHYGRKSFLAPETGKMAVMRLKRRMLPQGHYFVRSWKINYGVVKSDFVQLR